MPYVPKGKESWRYVQMWVHPVMYQMILWDAWRRKKRNQTVRSVGEAVRLILCDYFKEKLEKEGKVVYESDLDLDGNQDVEPL